LPVQFIIGLKTVKDYNSYQCSEQASRQYVPPVVMLSFINLKWNDILKDMNQNAETQKQNAFKHLIFICYLVTTNFEPVNEIKP